MLAGDVKSVIGVTSYEDEALECKSLVTAARSGSTAAFTELRALYAARVYRKLLTMTKNREDAEDALQDTFLQAYRALPNFEERSSFYTWITRIAINSALMILRRRRTRAEVSYDGPTETEESIVAMEFMDDAPSPERICLHRQSYACLLRSVWTLQPRLREVIEMQMLGSYSIREIAQTLGISESAVKSRLARARARLATGRGARSSKWAATVDSVSLPAGRAVKGLWRGAQTSNAVRMA